MRIKSLIKILVVLIVLAFAALYAAAKWWPHGPKPGTVPDEAKAAGRAPESFPAADEDYFQDMDGGVTKSMSPADRQHAVKGRNTWIVWTGGNDRFWDGLTGSTFGAFAQALAVTASTIHHNRAERSAITDSYCSEAKRFRNLRAKPR